MKTWNLCLIFLGMCLASAAQGQDQQRKEILRFQQTHYLEGSVFGKHRVTGKGVRIAVIDAGFPGTNTHPGFEHLFREGRIIATHDFIDGDDNVYHGHWHGTAVLSCIAGVLDGLDYGLAPNAEFLLARTEMKGEPKQEEELWVQAVEWALENGADIIQSSIGYTYHRYFPEEMDGKTSLAAKVASKAARQGVLLVNSAGNEGGARWKTLGTPADADSILTVGALDPMTALPSGFTSVGPTSDGRLKPNVCAPGTVVAFSSDGGTRIVDGTSFSAPLVAGFAACVMELNPNDKAFEILSKIEKTGHLYPYFDYSQGYGVPQASRLYENTGQTNGCLKVSESTEGILEIEANPDCNPKRKTPFSSLLYYQVLNSDQKISTYGITSMNFYTGTKLALKNLKPGDMVRFSFNGSITEWRKAR